MALTPRQLAVIRARARAKKAKPAAEMQRPTALGGLGYQPEEEASRQAFRQGAANVAVPSAGPQQPKAPTRLSAAAGQFAQSATLGQAPNILAAPYAMTGQFPEAKAFYQQRLMQGAEKFPVTTGAADIAGFLAPGGAVLKGATTLARPVTRAVQTAPAIVRGVATVAGGAALGATEGALYGGTVQAERQAMEQGQAAPTMQQRGEAAVPAAGMGAVVGGALPIVGKALAPVGTAIAGQAVKAFGPGATARQAERVAQKAVRADLRRAGINNLDDFLKAAEQYQGKPVMTAELTQSMTNSLTALTRAKGTTGDKVQAILENRIQGFPERMMRDLQEATGLDPAAIVDNLDDLIQSRQALAAPQYEKALAQPFTMTPTLEVLMKDSPEAASAFKEVERILKTELAGTGKTLEDVPKLDVYDRVKKILDERVRRLREEGKTSQAKAISDFTQRLRNELDVIVPEKYKAARLIGGEAPSLRDANKAGIKAYRLPFDMFKKEFAKVKGADAEAFKGAFVREISNIIEKNPARASAILAPEFQSKLRLMFGKDAADRLTANVRNEIAMRTAGARFNPNVGAVSSQALMGVPSQQADEILAAGEATLEFAQNLSGGRWASAVGPVLNYFRRAGYTEAQLNAIGDLLASDPQRAARILFPNEMARLGATPGGAAATNVLANPTQPPSGGRNTLAMPPKPLQKAQAEGYAGADIGEAQEWVQARSKGLDMSQRARTQRAKEQGFTINAYHGTAEDVAQFSANPPMRFSAGQEGAIFFTEKPDLAASYASYKDRRLTPQLMEAKAKGESTIMGVPRTAEEMASRYQEGGNVMPVKLRMQQPLVVDAKGKNWSEVWGDALSQAQAQGADGVIMKNVRDWGDAEAALETKNAPRTVYALFDPSNIRSTNAAFDPASKQSANILAGVGAIGAGAAMTGAIRPPERKKPPGQRPRG